MPNVSIARSTSQIFQIGFLNQNRFLCPGRRESLNNLSTVLFGKVSNRTADTERKKINLIFVTFTFLCVFLALFQVFFNLFILSLLVYSGKGSFTISFSYRFTISFSYIFTTSFSYTFTISFSFSFTSSFRYTRTFTISFNSSFTYFFSCGVTTLFIKQ